MLDGAIGVLAAPVIITDVVLSELVDATELCIASDVDLVLVVVTIGAFVLDEPLAVKTLSVGLATPPAPRLVVEVATLPPVRVPAVTIALYVGNAKPVPGGYCLVSVPSLRPNVAVAVMMQSAVVGASVGESLQDHTVVMRLGPRSSVNIAVPGPCISVTGPHDGPNAQPG